MVAAFAFATHEHEWTEHLPTTVGAKSVWTCSGCPLFGDFTPDPSPSGVRFSLLDMYRANTAATAIGGQR